MTLTPYRIFYAHKASADPAALRAEAAVVQAFIQSVIPEKAVEAITGFDDHERHFRRCGGWDAWCRDVALGSVYGTGAPRYHALVVPDDVVGNATRSMVVFALDAGKPVLLWNKDAGTAAKVVRVDDIEGASPRERARLRT